MTPKVTHITFVFIVSFAFACKPDALTTPRTGMNNGSGGNSLSYGNGETEYEQQTEDGKPIITGGETGTGNGTETGGSTSTGSGGTNTFDPGTPSALRTCYGYQMVGTRLTMTPQDSTAFSPCGAGKVLSPTGQGNGGDNFISGRIFLDANMNGVEDPGEQAAPYPTQLYIDENNNCIMDNGEIWLRPSYNISRTGLRYESSPFFSTVGNILSTYNGVPTIRAIPAGTYTIRSADPSYFIYSTDGTNGFQMTFSQGTKFENISVPLIRVRDFGDAPASYGSADTFHEFKDGVLLGSSLGFEQAAKVSSAADGDDKYVCNDDDGVKFPFKLKYGNSTQIEVYGSYAGGILNAWIDFNKNGRFDPTERVLDYFRISAGMNRLTINIPANPGLTAPVTTFARFRLSPLSLLNSGGQATADIQPTGGSSLGGEVEDYQVTIE